MIISWSASSLESIEIHQKTLFTMFCIPTKCNSNDNDSSELV
jgi:hypothetical protein